MTEIKVAETLDVTGHKCPIPILRVRRALEKISMGAILKVLATDPMTMIDFPHFCQQAGHELLETTQQDNIFIYLVKKVSDEG